MQRLGKLVGVIQIQIKDRVLDVDIDWLRLGRRAPLQPAQNVPGAVIALDYLESFCARETHRTVRLIACCMRSTGRLISNKSVRVAIGRFLDNHRRIGEGLDRQRPQVIRRPIAVRQDGISINCTPGSLRLTSNPQIQ
jgi:hypothetical protein